MRPIKDGKAGRDLLRDFLLADGPRMRVLECVARQGLPDCWVGAGFVRSLVWGRLHGRTLSPISGDVDVIWFDPDRATSEADDQVELALATAMPNVHWSVKNQSRMHVRNGDPPYASCEEAMRHWPETATSVAVRLNGTLIDILGPFGLDDLFSLMVRPTPAFAGAKTDVILARVGGKGWMERWPMLQIADAG